MRVRLGLSDAEGIEEAGGQRKGRPFGRDEDEIRLQSRVLTGEENRLRQLRLVSVNPELQVERGPLGPQRSEVTPSDLSNSTVWYQPEQKTGAKEEPSCLVAQMLDA